MAERQPPARRDREDLAVERDQPPAQARQAETGRSALHLRAGRRGLSQAVSRPRTHRPVEERRGNCTRAGGAGRSVGGREDRSAGGAGASLLHRCAGLVQFRLLRLQRARHSKAAGGAVLGRALQLESGADASPSSDDPFIGFQDAGNAARAAGLVRIRDLGDPTRREIDLLFKVLTALKRRKHFYGLWRTVVTAGNWMKSGDVVIESMWAVSISPLQVLRLPGPPGGAARGLPRFRRLLLDLERRDRPGEAPRLLRLPQLVELRLCRRGDAAVRLSERSRGDEPPLHAC